jgi:hypothetical protein
MFKVVLEALAEQIDRLRGEVFIRGCEIERLKEENAELKRQRDALCRKETDNA